MCFYGQNIHNLDFNIEYHKKKLIIIGICFDENYLLLGIKCKQT